MNKTVLVIEDSRFLRKSIELSLVNRGFQVITAADGEEGLQLALAMQPDIIITDWFVPKLSGAPLMQKLQEDARTCGIPVFVISARIQSKDTRISDAPNAMGFFPKDSMVLDQLVETLLNI